MKLPSLVFVSGKGGVGKTTIAGLLASQSSAQGLKTAIVEVNGERQLSQWFGRSKREFGPIHLRPNLDLFSLDAMSCLQDFGEKKLGSKRIVQAFLRHRVIENLVDGVPGFHDLFQLGKINHLVTDNGSEGPYERVIVDTPSTGHAKSLFSAAASIRELTVVGPVHDEAKQIAKTICDPSTAGAILVTNPESLPISETLAFTADWQEDHPPIQGIIINRWLEGTELSRSEWATAQRCIQASDCSELAHIATTWQLALKSQKDQLEYLKKHLCQPTPIGVAYETTRELNTVRLEWPNR